LFERDVARMYTDSMQREKPREVFIFVAGATPHNYIC